MQLHKQIEEAVQQGWNEGAKVHVLYEIVSANGFVHPNLTYPHKGDIKLPDGSICMLINVSLSACKMFSYDEEYSEFVYDIAVGGKPFMGNIPPNLIKAVYDLDTREVYYHQSQQVYESVGGDDVALKPKSVSTGYIGWEKDVICYNNIKVFTQTAPKGKLTLVQDI